MSTPTTVPKKKVRNHNPFTAFQWTSLEVWKHTLTFIMVLFNLCQNVWWLNQHSLLLNQNHWPWWKESDPFFLIAVHQPPKLIDPSPVTSHWLLPCYRATWHVPELSYTLLEVQSLCLLDLGALLCSALSFLLGLHGWSNTCTAVQFDKSLCWYQSDQGVVALSLHSHKMI